MATDLRPGHRRRRGRISQPPTLVIPSVAILAQAILAQVRNPLWLEVSRQFSDLLRPARPVGWPHSSPYASVSSSRRSTAQKSLSSGSAKAAMAILDVTFEENAPPQPRSSTSRIAPQLTRPLTPGLALKKAMVAHRTLKPKLRLVLASERLTIGRRVVDSATYKPGQQ